LPVLKLVTRHSALRLASMLTSPAEYVRRTPQKIGILLMALALSACSEAPSWQKLLASKITQQYPDYKAVAKADGSLLVERPGLAPVPVDVDDIAKFCLRGPKDCNYATDQMLTALQRK
jgi:hypothetical protein